jgi:hypothetical protein
MLTFDVNSCQEDPHNRVFTLTQYWRSYTFFINGIPGGLPGLRTLTTGGQTKSFPSLDVSFFLSPAGLLILG